MSLAGGSSYSKTDTDATFMGSKDDHLGNGQLKASYNVQIGTNKPYVLHYSVHQQPTDMTTLPGQIAAYEASYGQLPAALVADAGYSWTANYALLASKSVVSYIKEQGYEQAKKKVGLSHILLP